MERLRVGAEQALLGAVLLDPDREQQVLDWVEPADMYRPWHGQVLAAMQRLHERGTSPAPLDVYAELQRNPDLPRSVARNAVPLADLMSMAPRAEHAPRYAAMVIEGGIRQRLQLAASRTAQAAGTGDLPAALRQAQLARHELRTCRTRWLALPEPCRPEFSPRLLAEESARVESARPQGCAAAAASERAIRDLADGPSQLARIRGWLRPEHFARPEHGDLYAVMRDLDATGGAVDPITVTWEAARRGTHVDPAALSGGIGIFAVASAREVRRHGLLAQVAHAGSKIQAEAGDSASHLGRFLRSADERLRALETQAQAEPGSTRGASVVPLRSSAQADVRKRQPDREAVP